MGEKYFHHLDLGQVEYSCERTNECKSLLHIIHRKQLFKWDHRSKYKKQNLMMLNENVGEILHDLELGKKFLEIIAKKKDLERKNDKMCFIKIKITVFL